MLTFGEKLKQARISKKLTQKQLSDKLDVSNTVITVLETSSLSLNCFCVSFFDIRACFNFSPNVSIFKTSSLMYP